SWHISRKTSAPLKCWGLTLAPTCRLALWKKARVNFLKSGKWAALQDSSPHRRWPSAWHNASGARYYSPAPRLAHEDRLVLLLSLVQNTACAHWPKVWHASLARKISMWP